MVRPRSGTGNSFVVTCCPMALASTSRGRAAPALPATAMTSPRSPEIRCMAGSGWSCRSPAPRALALGWRNAQFWRPYEPVQGLRCPQRSRRAGRQRRPLMGDLAAGGFQQLLVIDPRELEEAERVIAAVRSSQTVVPSYPDGIKAAGAGLSTGPQAAGPPSRHRLGAGLGWAGLNLRRGSDPTAAAPLVGGLAPGRWSCPRAASRGSSG